MEYSMMDIYPHFSDGRTEALRDVTCSKSQASVQAMSSCRTHTRNHEIALPLCKKFSPNGHCFHRAQKEMSWSLLLIVLFCFISEKNKQQKAKQREKGKERDREKLLVT